MTDFRTSDTAQAVAGEGTDRDSYRRIFKSTSVVGGAQVVSILIGVMRNKAIALLLGPAGIGLIGLLYALMSAAATIVQMGLNTVGTRQIAEAHATGELERVAVARHALMIVTLFLAVLGGGGMWLFRDVLSVYALQNAELAYAVGWIGVGVALSVAALAQASLLQGMRQIRLLVFLQIGSAMLLTLLGLPLFWAFGQEAIPFYVVAMPLINFVLGHVLVAKLERLPPVALNLSKLATQWRMFLALGLPMVGTGVATALVTLWIQAHIKAELGIDALGYYVASNTIAMQYVGLVLGAMSADYYPRLTGIIGNHAAARRLVNQQTEVALQLAGPMILFMFMLAPWVIQLLYSDAFGPAADVLRWQTAGTLLKVITWPMGFILLAAGAGRIFLMTEVLTLLVMAGASTLLLNRFGIVGAGMGYFVAYVFYLTIMILLAAPKIKLIWSSLVLRTFGMLTGGLIALLWPVFAPSPLSFAVGMLVVGAASIYLALKVARTLELSTAPRGIRRTKR